MSVSGFLPFRGRSQLPCEAIDRDAVAYFFNGLPVKRREAVRAHLTRCRRCRRKLEVFERVWLRHGRRR